MQNHTFSHAPIRRAIAFVVALIPSVAFAALPLQASAMKIQITDIQGDSYPSWRPCPFTISFSGLYNVLDYTGSPHVKFVYHWETVGALSGRTWHSKSFTDEFDLRDLAEMAKMPGLSPSDIHDYKQTNNTMGTSPIDSRYAKHVSLVFTQPVYAKKTIDVDAFCHS